MADAEPHQYVQVGLRLVEHGGLLYRVAGYVSYAVALHRAHLGLRHAADLAVDRRYLEIFIEYRAELRRLIGEGGAEGYAELL